MDFSCQLGNERKISLLFGESRGAGAAWKGTGSGPSAASPGEGKGVADGGVITVEL